MTNESTDDIYERINLLTARERQLREELASVRLERASLKARCSYINLNRPKWMNDLPENFWYPSYYSSKVVNGLHPNLDNGNIPADLNDWVKSSGIKEFVVNLAIGIGIVIVTLQLIVIIL